MAVSIVWSVVPIVVASAQVEQTGRRGLSTGLGGEWAGGWLSYRTEVAGLWCDLWPCDR